MSQLITDFGRTHNLVLSAKSNAKAQLESERATELDITLTVDQAFYHALTTQAVLKVAQQTVAQRQATGDQVSALTKAKIRSDLDLSFANVQIAQANLLLLDADQRRAGRHGGAERRAGFGDEPAIYAGGRDQRQSAAGSLWIRNLWCRRRLARGLTWRR